MTTSKVAVTEGAGTHVATYSFPEDTITKMVQRVALNDSSGAEVAPIASSTKGNPTGEMLTVQDGNARLLLDAVTLTSAGEFFMQALNTDGLAFGILSLTVSQVGVGSVIIVQGSNKVDGPWTTLRLANAVADTDAGSISTTGNYVVDVPFAFVRVALNAHTSGSATVIGMFSKGQLSKRQVSITGNAGPGGTPPNPVQIGIVSRTSNIAAAGNNAAAHAAATQVGALISKPYSIPELDWSKGGLALSASNQALVAAGTAGIRNYMTWGHISCSAEWTANTLQIMDGSTVIYELDLPAGAGIYPLPPLASPLKTSAAAALNVKATGAVTGVCKVNAGGYQAP